MKLDVKLFGSLAQATGCRTVEVDLPAGATGEALLRALGDSHAQAQPILQRVSIAVNLEVVPIARVLEPTDEVAILPPVSGGATIAVGVRGEPSVDEALAAVAAPGAGGTAVFLGTVRDRADAGDVDILDYDTYDEMADRVMAQIATEAAEKWGLAGVAIFHGTGSFAVGETTMVVACSAPHREEAFDACRYIVDEVKRRVPVWKKESGPWGERWIE